MKCILKYAFKLPSMLSPEEALERLRCNVLELPGYKYIITEDDIKGHKILLTPQSESVMFYCSFYPIISVEVTDEQTGTTIAIQGFTQRTKSRWMSLVWNLLWALCIIFQIVLLPAGPLSLLTFLPTFFALYLILPEFIIIKISMRSIVKQVKSFLEAE